MQKGAIISECGKYRYRLWRIWDDTKPQCMFIMLNPSTADADLDDPTIRRCIGFAKSWGYGGLQVCNLFAYRSTEPRELLKVFHPGGLENIWHLREAAAVCEIVVCSWGNHAIVDKLMKGKSEYALLAEFPPEKLHYIEISLVTLRPKHPLYLRGDLLPVRI